MTPFSYARPESAADAVREQSAHADSRFIAGGTNILDLMKENVARPRHLVDITHLPLREVAELPDGGLRIGALVSNAAIAYHPAVEQRYPLLASAILAGATPQLRNMASTGGNLLQRTRCYYFYDVATPCNKRAPGSGCGARDGVNRIHAILGASAECIATHPSDMCVALAALDAVVRVTGPDGEHSIPFRDFHRLPGDTPERDTNLGENELITAVDLPAESFATHYTYLKLRDRSSFAFALVSVAVSLSLEGGTIREARLALGGVAHKPWRDAEVEGFLRGKSAGAEVFGEAAAMLLRDARGHGGNDFKIPLARAAIPRALAQAAAGTPQSQIDKRIA
jgi:xanthine dehydrogenase YagS FAD-binding subunit